MATGSSQEGPSAWAWVDEVDPSRLLHLLSEHGTDVNTLVSTGCEGPAPQDPPPYQVVPLREGWLRIGLEDDGSLVGHWLEDPGRPELLRPGPPIRFDEADADDLAGWLRARADIDGSGRRWVAVLRRPEREAYAALVYDAGETGPVRRQVISGVYPDITLCDEEGGHLAFVEPDRAVKGRTLAVLAPVEDLSADSRRVLRDSTQGGLGVRACSVRRFVKLSHGVRTTRLWELVDVREPRPAPIMVPGVPNDPDLFDVATLGDAVVLVQGVNLLEEGTARPHWELAVSLIEYGEVLQGWHAATGAGTVREVTSGEDCALVRVSEGDVERLLKIPIGGFSTTAARPLLSSSGLFTLAGNSVTPAVGFSAVELSGGSLPYSWFWDRKGEVLNPAEEVAARAAARTRRALLRVTGEDGYEFDLDVRWPAEAGEVFRGPVLLMVYGAYGIDLDLDSDRDLGRWLDRGFAVATPHVRGGGPEARHLAGCRARRDRSVADVAAAIRWLRAGYGAVIADRICVLGASAGGFLAATTLNSCPDLVEACVIVNGFLDPLGSLLRRDTPTAASDQDEWGDPHTNPNDLETLQAISPVDNLAGTPRDASSSRALVVVSANDVRVNPRQGLKWYLGYRALGGPGELWFDPNGAHDCWGAQMDPEAMVDWVCAALGV